MKFVICVLILVGFFEANAVNNSNDPIDKDIQDALKECKKSVDQLTEDVSKVFKEFHVPQTKEAFCVIGCVLKKVDAITGDNKLNSLKAQQLLAETTHMPISAAEQMINTCKKDVDKNSATECDSALALMKCLNNVMKKIIPV